MAKYRIEGRHVALLLTPLEARGLSALADEGAAGLLVDPEAARGYIGNKEAQVAARRAAMALGQAAYAASHSKGKR